MFAMAQRERRCTLSPSFISPSIPGLVHFRHWSLPEGAASQRRQQQDGARKRILRPATGSSWHIGIGFNQRELSPPQLLVPGTWSYHVVYASTEHRMSLETPNGRLSCHLLIAVMNPHTTLKCICRRYQSFPSSRLEVYSTREQGYSCYGHP